LNELKAIFIEEYIINPYTMFIKPEVYGSRIYSKIYELEEIFLSPFKPQDIIRASCAFYCSGYRGRVEGTHRLIGKTHKAPIAIDPQNSLYFFPTASPKRQDCIWINSQLVEDYLWLSATITKVLFKNNESHDIPISTRVFKNQLLRTSHLRAKLIQRMDETERKTYIYLHNPKYLSAFEGRDQYGKAIKRKETSSTSHFEENLFNK
jgi:competence protein ComK